METKSKIHPGKATFRTTHSIENNGHEKYLEKIFSGINAILFVFDLNNYRMVWTNAGFRKILGYRIPKRKIQKSELLDVHHPNDISFLDEMKDFFLNNPKGTFTGILQFRKKNGDFIWLCTSANIFRRDDDESVFEIVGVSINFNESITYDRHLKYITRQKLALSNMDVIERLSKREIELIKLFATGNTTRQIADHLGISFHTVNNHRKNILKKLELSNLAALVNFAVEHGLN